MSSVSEDELDIDRLFYPKRAVVIEDGDALFRRDEVCAAGCGYRPHKVENRALGSGVLPRGARKEN